MESMHHYKQFLIEQHNQKISNFINEVFMDVDKESSITIQLKSEIIGKLNNYSQKSANQLSGKLYHLITQLAKNYPRNPLDQQRLQKVIREVIKVAGSNVEINAKISSEYVDDK